MSYWTQCITAKPWGPYSLLSNRKTYSASGCPLGRYELGRTIAESE